MNILIVGNNTKFAALFNSFSKQVYILLDLNKDTTENRLSTELNQFELIQTKCNNSSIFNVVCRAAEIKRIVETKKIDLVFSNRKDDMFATWIASRFIRRRLIKVVTFHNSYAWLHKHKVSLMKWAIKLFTDGNIALSHLSYDQLIQSKNLAKKTLYMPNILQCSEYNTKSDYFIGSTVNICCVAVISPHKNQGFIVDAAKEIAKKYVDKCFQLHFIGDVVDVDYANEIMDKVKQTGNIKVFLEGRKELDYIKQNLKKYDIYISASKLEMSPYNILEAQATGLPILASNTFGHNDLIFEGLNGMLFELGDLGDITKKIETLLLDINLRAKLGSSARNRIEVEDSFSKHSNKLKEYIKTL